MPELPDVEAYREVFQTCAVGRVVRRVDVRDAGVLHGVSARRLREALERRKFTGLERHGKWLLARTGGGHTLMLHFGMTGRLVCDHPDAAAEPHDRVLFTVGRDRQLRFRDQRKLQGLWLADDAGVARLLDRQGPDAMAVDREEFEAALTARRGSLKSALIDQSVLAGLGNLLADEILWRAGLRPTGRAGDLTEADRRRLHTEMRRTLRSSVTAGCVPPRDSWLTGHRDDPDPHCPRCGTFLRRTRLAGRTTVWCPRCQPGDA
ncbi:Fpg/Nei family DNA glycosylase [Streptomyces spinoverrucosus]|uniref:DNA-formamidopyrimidine glycosylase family protein n=1 Tax=Streptomyces spinoverrucosus TaxID=284043 RepID=UPI0018C3B6A5|nr:DNA-formamidopyrimidine glycosylase family protein [Streptomyces spinoverrucosus]MBG0854102.1 Fpg/Nei family DNA glycosylase [Streptomyces spinoverrucosus]